MKITTINVLFAIKTLKSRNRFITKWVYFLWNFHFSTLLVDIRTNGQYRWQKAFTQTFIALFWDGAQFGKSVFWYVWSIRKCIDQIKLVASGRVNCDSHYTVIAFRECEPRFAPSESTSSYTPSNNIQADDVSELFQTDPNTEGTRRIFTKL